MTIFQKSQGEIMKQRFIIGLFLLGAFTLTGCSSNAGNGALIGSLVGAGIGKSTVDHSDRRAAIGAVVGGILGTAAGADRDSKSSSYRSSNSSATTTRYVTSPQTVYINRPYPVRSTVVYNNRYIPRRSYRNRHTRHHHSRPRYNPNRAYISSRNHRYNDYR